MKHQENILFAKRYRLISFKKYQDLAQVWRAKDEQDGQDVLLRIFPAMEQAGIDGFIREYSYLSKLEHPNLLPVKAFDVCDEQAYMAIPYYPVSADRFSDALSEQEAWNFLHDTASALAYLHSMALLHGAVEPCNIWQDGQGHFRLAPPAINPTQRILLRRHALVVEETDPEAGNKEYIAPEAWYREPQYMPASDIWALGLCLRNLLTDKRTNVMPDDFSDETPDGKEPENPEEIIARNYSPALANLVFARGFSWSRSPKAGMAEIKGFFKSLFGKAKSRAGEQNKPESYVSVQSCLNAEPEGRPSAWKLQSLAAPRVDWTIPVRPQASPDDILNSDDVLNKEGCEPVSAFRPGDWVVDGAYQLQRQVLEGNVSEWNAIDSHGRHLSLWISVPLEGNALPQIEKELDRIAALKHPNLIPVEKNGFWGNRAYLVTPSYAPLLQKTGQAEESDAWYWFRDILEGMVYLHENRIRVDAQKIESWRLDEEGHCRIPALCLSKEIERLQLLRYCKGKDIACADLANPEKFFQAPKVREDFGSDDFIDYCLQRCGEIGNTMGLFYELLAGERPFHGYGYDAYYNAPFYSIQSRLLFNAELGRLPFPYSEDLQALFDWSFRSVDPMDFDVWCNIENMLEKVKQHRLPLAVKQYQGVKKV